MSAAARRRGRTWQTAVRQYLADAGLSVVETGGAGLDSGDLLVLGTPNVAVEAKNQQRMDLSGWLDQAVRQAPAGAVPVVAHKRVGRGDVGESYVTLRACDFLRLVQP